MRRRDGSGVDMIGRPLDRHPEPSPGIAIWSEEMGMKAKANGIYFLNGHPFIMQAGQILPDGAVIDMAEEEVEDAFASHMITALGEERLTLDDDAFAIDTEPETEERAIKAAPQNRKKLAPENR
jgi:hypothetical protein